MMVSNSSVLLLCVLSSVGVCVAGGCSSASPGSVNQAPVDGIDAGPSLPESDASAARDAGGGFENTPVADTEPYSAEPVSAQAIAECNNRLSEAFGDRARAFMQAKGLIRAGEESTQSGVTTRWRAASVRPVPLQYSTQSRCAVAMNLYLSVGDASERGAIWEAVVYTPGSDRFDLLEDALVLPSKVYVGIGSSRSGQLADGGAGDPSMAPLFYAAMVGPGLLAAYKVILTHAPAQLLRGWVSVKNAKMTQGVYSAEPDGKLAFDPTPARTWKLTNATLDLRRGYTPEINDINPGLIDQDFSNAYSESGLFEIAPWGDSELRRWRLPSEARWKVLPFSFDMPLSAFHKQD